MRLLFTILILLASNPVLGSHPYSVTTVHADLQDDCIILTVRTNAEDLLYFHRLDFDSMMNMRRSELLEAALKHGDIIMKHLYILDENDRRIESGVIAANIASLEHAGSIGVMQLMKYPLSYTLRFPLEPETTLLQFRQTMEDVGVPAVSLLSVSKNANVLVENVELTKSKPFTIGRFATSVGSPAQPGFMLSYLTLTDSRIAHELTIPMAMFRSLVSFSVDDRDSALVQLREFIAENSKVIVNGIEITPEVAALVLQGTMNDLPGKPSLVGVRLEYPLSRIPRGVSIQWHAYNWQVRWFTSVIDAFGSPAEHNFSRFTPEFRMERKIPLRKD